MKLTDFADQINRVSKLTPNFYDLTAKAKNQPTFRMKLSGLILKLTVIFIELTERRGRFPQNRWEANKPG